jgi:hypothetical protein
MILETKNKMARRSLEGHIKDPMNTRIEETSRREARTEGGVF